MIEGRAHSADTWGRQPIALLYSTFMPIDIPQGGHASRHARLCNFDMGRSDLPTLKEAKCRYERAMEHLTRGTRFTSMSKHTASP